MEQPKVLTVFWGLWEKTEWISINLASKKFWTNWKRKFSKIAWWYCGWSKVRSILWIPNMPSSHVRILRPWFAQASDQPYCSLRWLTLACHILCFYTSTK